MKTSIIHPKSNVDLLKYINILFDEELDPQKSKLVGAFRGFLLVPVIEGLQKDHFVAGFFLV